MAEEILRLTYCDEPLLLGDPDQELRGWLDRYLEQDGRRLFGWSESRSPINWPPPPKLKINTLWWPTGATRWGVGLFLVHETNLRRIFAALDTSGTNRRGKLRYSLFPTPTNPAVESSAWMHALTPQRVVAGDKRQGLWLLPLVDQRYFWQDCRADLSNLSNIADPTASWAALVDRLFNAVGAEHSTSSQSDWMDAVSPYYRFPCLSEFAKPASAAYLLDVAAASIGKRVVLDPHIVASDVAGGVRVKLMGCATAETILRANLYANQTVQVAGGCAKYELTQTGDPCWSGPQTTISFDAANRPELLRVAFPKAPDVNRSCPASCHDDTESIHHVAVPASLHAYSWTPGASKAFGDTAVDRGDAATRSHLSALASQVASDFYAMTGFQYDASFAGIRSWRPSGFDDFLEYSFAHQDAQGNYRCLTRAASLPANCGVTTLWHQPYMTECLPDRWANLGPWIELKTSLAPGGTAKAYKLISKNGYSWEKDEKWIDDLAINESDNTYVSSAATAFEADDVGKTLTIVSGDGFYCYEYTIDSLVAPVYCDLAIDPIHANKVSSATRPFTAFDVGLTLSITGGEGFATGDHIITGVASGVAILDDSAGTLGSIGGAGELTPSVKLSGDAGTAGGTGGHGWVGTVLVHDTQAAYRSLGSDSLATDRLHLRIDAVDGRVVYSDGAAFTAADKDHFLTIASGTGFTAGVYRITDVADGAALLDRSAGNLASTGGVGTIDQTAGARGMVACVSGTNRYEVVSMRQLAKIVRATIVANVMPGDVTVAVYATSSMDGGQNPLSNASVNTRVDLQTISDKKNLGSASLPFVASEIGMAITLSGGGFTAGVYLVESVVDGVATLDRDATETSGAMGTGTLYRPLAALNEGGAFGSGKEVTLLWDETEESYRVAAEGRHFLGILDAVLPYNSTEGVTVSIWRRNASTNVKEDSGVDVANVLPPAELGSGLIPAGAWVEVLVSEGKATIVEFPRWHWGELKEILVAGGSADVELTDGESILAYDNLLPDGEYLPAGTVVGIFLNSNDGRWYVICWRPVTDFGSDSSGPVGSSSQPSGSQPPSGSEGSGSDKTTAIVPASWSPTGYTALFIAECPEVRFDDVMVVTVTETDASFQIDPRFLEVCERGSVQVCGCVADVPVAIGAVVADGKVRVRVSPIDVHVHTEMRVVLRLTGVRRGFQAKRFPNRTRGQFEANERFINSAYANE